MCIKMMYSIITFKNVFLKWQSSTMQNRNYLCTNLILIYVLMLECYYMEIHCNILTSSLIVRHNFLF